MNQKQKEATVRAQIVAHLKEKLHFRIAGENDASCLICKMCKAESEE